MDELNSNPVESPRHLDETDQHLVKGDPSNGRDQLNHGRTRRKCGQTQSKLDRARPRFARIRLGVRQAQLTSSRLRSRFAPNSGCTNCSCCVSTRPKKNGGNTRTHWRNKSEQQQIVAQENDCDAQTENGRQSKVARKLPKRRRALLPEPCFGTSARFCRLGYGKCRPKLVDIMLTKFGRCRPTLAELWRNIDQACPMSIDN